MSNVYSDAYINHYADIWLARKLKQRGISLAQFLANPSHYDDEFLPLLDAQQKVADRLAADDAVAAHAERGTENLPRRNGAIVEPLHHHAHPRSASRDFHVERDLSEREP